MAQICLEGFSIPLSDATKGLRIFMNTTNVGEFNLNAIECALARKDNKETDSFYEETSVTLPETIYASTK